MRSFGKIVSVLILAGMMLCTTACKSEKNNKTTVNSNAASSESVSSNVNAGQPADAVVTSEERKYDYLSAYKGYLENSEKDKDLKYFLYDIKKNNVKDGIRELFLEKIENEKKQIDVYTVDEDTGEVSLCGSVQYQDSADLSVKESEIYLNNAFKTVHTVTHITIDEKGKLVNGLVSQTIDENFTPRGKLLEGCDVSSDELLNKYTG